MAKVLAGIRPAIFRAHSRPISLGRAPAVSTPDFVGEPAAPCVKTETVPGPKHYELAAELKKRSDASSLIMFLDYQRSQGNYICDADGNILLDSFCQIASLPLGYNHPDIAEALAKPENIQLMTARPALGSLPPIEWPEMLDRVLMAVAPRGFNKVQTMMCGSSSNENAIKAACLWFARKRRGENAYSDEESSSCMENMAPGSKPYRVLSFSGAFHGRTLGVLSCTRSKVIHKMDIPAFNWPKADFPRLKYPLEANQDANAKEEERCLRQVEELLKENDTRPDAIAAMIVEPIPAEGGDLHASHNFFRKLRAIAEKSGVCFIVDEVQTGLGHTGRVWAHEDWELDNPPDIVTFSKRMQTGGYYYRDEFSPVLGYQIYNTWMGDPSKMIILEAVLNAIKRDSLIENSAKTGAYLQQGIFELQKAYPNIVHSARGRGTFCAFDALSPQIRDKILMESRVRGLFVGGCGDQTIRFRPSLTFKPRHVEQTISILDSALKTI